jgi:uncharacterized protein (TIGR02266 family)
MREFSLRPGRAPIEMNVEVKAGAECFSAKSKNIGVGGLFVATDRRFHVGQPLIVELALPRHVRPIAVGAEVRWIREVDGRPSGTGLRFVNPSFGVTVAIHELLRIWARI